MEQNFIKKFNHVYFIGIGGVSMSGLAEILLYKGHRVSGSDMRSSAATKHLEEKGAKINIGHKNENITDDIDLVVYTAAIKENNHELIAAKEKNINIIDRAKLLGEVMKQYSRSIAVSGTHGKTTTTSMISQILLYDEKDPTISVGGTLKSINGNIRIGNSEIFVAEACEYFDSFLKFSPYIAIILNVEADHLDYFKDLEQIRSSFKHFAEKVPENGYVIINGNIKDIEFFTKELKCNFLTFGAENSGCNFEAVNVNHMPDGKNNFDVLYNKKHICSVSLNVPGDHNILNALSACAAAYIIGIPSESITEGLKSFDGAVRRFQYKGSVNGVKVIDDYAHHPTEIKATLSAAKKMDHKKIWCIFQPHTYTRTKALFNDFVNSFENADKIIITDIFAAREKDTGLIHAKSLADKIKSNGKDAIYISSFSEIESYINQHCESGDIVITMGAGDIYTVGENIINI